jgi:hypothetical protein
MKTQMMSSLLRVEKFAMGFCFFSAIALLAAMNRTSFADDEFQSLVSQIPRSANAVVLLNMQQAKNSPLGLKEGWNAKVEKAFESGLSRVPPQSTRYVLASQIDLEFMEPLWTAAICDLDVTPSLEQIAKRRHGTLDTIENLPAVALPNDTYLVQLGPKTLGMMAPANRQAVVRWIREVRGSSPPPLSPYLQQAAVFSDGTGSQIIMALDLDGALSFERVGKYLKAKENRLKEWKADMMELAKLLSDVRGIRIGVRIGDQMSAKIAVDLRGNASAIASFAKPLLLQILSDAGASINDLQSWTAQGQGNEISLAGTLGGSGLRRLMSVVEPPAFDEDVVAKPSEMSPGELLAVQAKTSREHYRAVTGMFNDLKGDMRESKNLASTALWFDKYAKRIERLPILNVDEDLLKYSAFVADSLRKAGGVMRTMGIQSNVRESQIISSSAGTGYAPYSVGRYGAYGGYGASGVATYYNPVAEAKGVFAERRVVRAEEKSIAATDVHKLREQVIAATTDIRRKMTQKYQIEF